MPISDSEKEYLKTPLKLKQDDLRKEIDFLKNKVYDLRMRFLKDNPDFVAENDITHSLTLPGAMEHNLAVEMLMRKQKEFENIQDKLVDPIIGPFDDEKEYQTIVSKELVSTLIKMADKFDAENKNELASVVDNTLKVLAARPKAPLKNVEDADFLNIYLVKSDNKLKDVLKHLEDLNARLRYFDLLDAVKDIKLEQLIGEVEKVEGDINNASKKFYEMSHGKKPGKETFTQMVKDFADKDPTEQSAKDFFNYQDGKGREELEEGVFQRDEKGERQPSIKETLTCDDCGEEMPLKVLHSAAGYYLGRECSCGPYSRESKYFKTQEEAEEYLSSFAGTQMAKDDEPLEEKQEDGEGIITEEELKNFWEEAQEK